MRKETEGTRRERATTQKKDKKTRSESGSFQEGSELGETARRANDNKGHLFEYVCEALILSSRAVVTLEPFGKPVGPVQCVVLPVPALRLRDV